MKNIYRILNRFNFDKDFIKRNLLPSWWDEAIADSEAGYLQTISLISKNLGINISALLTEADNLSFDEQLNFKLKKSIMSNIDVSSIWLKSISLRISNLIKQSFNPKNIHLQSDPLNFRSDFLKRFSSITLNNMLDYLWEIGIPTIYMSKFPKGINKMDGMSIYNNKFPIIVVSKKHVHEAWLLFIILHELGHIFLGHLKEGNVLLDSDIEMSKSDLNDKDDEEIEANTFALKFLSHEANPNFINEKIDNTFTLVSRAREIGRKYQIDPGTVLLNYAYYHNEFPKAQIALNNMFPKANAVDLIVKKATDHLSLDLLTEEDGEFFTNLINAL